MALVVTTLVTCLSLASTGPSSSTAYAASPTVGMPALQLKKAEIGTLPITVDGFTDLNSLTVTLRWNSAYLEVTGIAEGDLGGYFLSGKPEIANPVTIAWIQASPPLVSEGILGYVSFRPVAVGTSTPEITVVTASVFVEGEGNLEITDEVAVSSGAVTIVESVSAPTSEGSGVPQETSSSDGRGATSEGQPDVSNPSLVWVTDNATLAPNSAIKLTITPAEVLPNQETIVAATLCNTGAEPATKTVSLAVNGVMDQTQDISVAAGACESIRFVVSRPAPGTYQVAVDDMTGQFTVLPTVPAPPPAPGSEVVPPPAQNGIGTPVILAIVGVMLLLIAALVFFFRRV